MRIIAKHFAGNPFGVLRLDSVEATAGATERFFGSKNGLANVVVSRCITMSYKMVARVGIEPTTRGFSVRCSTN